MATRITIAKPNRPNGILSVPASATQMKSGGNIERNSQQPSARLKIIIRRLPPGLTQLEFEETLGDEWKVGGGKVSWSSYKAGKISKDLAKPSRPSRAYLHLTKQEYTNALAERVKGVSFVDVRGSSKDACLLGPPSVEFSPYGRIPNGRPRKDARQGTIDQDSEFMQFLESLTNPVAKSSSVDQDGDAAKIKEKVSVTPLVQFLRDKKANKVKEIAAAKNAKQVRPDKENKVAESKTAAQTAASPKKKTVQAARVEQAAREAAKVLNKQAGNIKAAPPAPVGPKAPPVTSNITPNSAANALASKQRERGNISAAAKILQRDLGIGGNARGRGGRRGVADSPGRNAVGNNPPATKQNMGASLPQHDPPPTKLDDVKISEPSPEPALTGQPAPARLPSGPAAGRTLQKPATSSPSQVAASNAVAPSSTSTQAFLKHANPSQGVTEPLLEEAFRIFGEINKVEIDKKKGFAYVDFVERESLQKAIKASPINVAQGSVQVLERKTGSTLQARNNVRNFAPVMHGPRGGGPMIGNHNIRGRPAMASTIRGGGVMGNRGPVPVGRGGHLGRRGGFGKGGANMAQSSQAKGALTASASTSKESSAGTATELQSTNAPAPQVPAAPVEPAGG